MDILPVSNSRNYFMGTASIKGVLSDEILADKISEISTDKIYKFRTKDLIYTAFLIAFRSMQKTYLKCAVNQNIQ